MIKSLHEHSFVIEPLQRPGATVLDIGCLNFKLAETLLGYGCRVCCVDPSPEIGEVPSHPSLKFVPKAVVSRANAAKHKCVHFNIPDDIYGAYAVTGSNPVKTPPNKVYGVQTIDITALTAQSGWGRWTAVKMDCEGSEYEILLDWPGPISDQISVEFHDHLVQTSLKATYDAILAHIGQWYKPLIFKRSGKHFDGHEMGGNYWDSLFVLK